MLNDLKHAAAEQMSRMLSSDAAMKVMSSAQFKNALVTAINLRAEARDAVEKGIKDLASSFELVTREDMAALRRSIRDLEDTVAELRDELDVAQAEVTRARQEASAARPASSQAQPAAPAKTEAKTRSAPKSAATKTATAAAGQGKPAARRRRSKPRQTGDSEA